MADILLHEERDADEVARQGRRRSIAGAVQGRSLLEMLAQADSSERRIRRLDPATV